MAFAADAVELWVFDQYVMVSGRVWCGFAEAAGGGGGGRGCGVEFGEDVGADPECAKKEDRGAATQG